MKRKAMFRTAITGTLAIVLCGVLFVSRAAAQCGPLGASNTEAIEPEFGLPQLMDVSFAEPGSAGDHIVGFWKAKFVAEGNSGGPPDGTVIDSPFVQWHDDGTEIMNSTRVPQTGSFCMGIWHRTGRLSYELNHFALSWDTNNNFVGPAQIRENVILDKKGDAYSGTFTIDQYDPSGNQLAEVKGNVTATRITVNTTINQVL
jgi:hypothetical protein